MLEQANRVSELGLSVTFQSWMLLSLLQFPPPPNKWAELLKDLGHRLPRIRVEHVNLQRAILRERALEGSALDLRQGARNIFGSWSYFSVDDASEPRPLYLCLGDPGSTDDASGSSALPGSNGGDIVDDSPMEPFVGDHCRFWCLVDGDVTRVEGDDASLRINIGEVLIANRNFISNVDDEVHGVPLLRPPPPALTPQRPTQVDIRIKVWEAVRSALLSLLPVCGSIVVAAASPPPLLEKNLDMQSAPVPVSGVVRTPLRDAKGFVFDISGESVKPRVLSWGCSDA